MIAVDEYKFKRSNVTLYDKDGNVVAIAKNVLITKDDDDLCKGHRLTDAESLSLLNFRSCNKTVSFTIEPIFKPLKDRKEI
jgi:hypothetical protein